MIPVHLHCMGCIYFIVEPQAGAPNWSKARSYQAFSTRDQRAQHFGIVGSAVTAFQLCHHFILPSEPRSSHGQSLAEQPGCVTVNPLLNCWYL